MRSIQLVSALVVAIHLGNAHQSCAAEVPAATSSTSQADLSQQQADQSEPATSCAQPVRLQMLVVELSPARLRASAITMDNLSPKNAPAACSATDRLFKSMEEAEGAGGMVVDENSRVLKTLEGLLAKGQ
jgi:hypothetical protein